MGIFDAGNCASFFNIENVKTAFKTVFKKRDNNLRMYIIMLIASFVLEVFLINGKGIFTVDCTSTIF